MTPINEEHNMRIRTMPLKSIEYRRNALAVKSNRLLALYNKLADGPPLDTQEKVDKCNNYLHRYNAAVEKFHEADKEYRELITVFGLDRTAA